MKYTGQTPFSSLFRRFSQAGLLTALGVLAACSVTGHGLTMSGLNQIVEGQTTMQQASLQLNAQPADIWQQGDTTLARWAFKGTVMTDAVYVRQEVWLRFGADGTFQRMENSINVPPSYRPRTAAQAAAAQSVAARSAVPVIEQTADDGSITIPGNGPDAPGFNPGTGVSASGAAAAPIPVAPPGASPAGLQPLLSPGAKVIPGVTYPLSES